MKNKANRKLYSYYPDYEPVSGLPWHLAFGKLRREAIKKKFLTNSHYQQFGLSIDRSWCPQLKNDKELKQLVKSGFLRIRRVFKHTSLVLNSKQDHSS